MNDATDIATKLDYDVRIFQAIVIQVYVQFLSPN